MHETMRFASLRGEARKWIEEDLYDDLEGMKLDSFGDLPSDDEHDGWAPIMPRKRYVCVADLVQAQRSLRSAPVRSYQTKVAR